MLKVDLRQKIPATVASLRAIMVDMGDGAKKKGSASVTQSVPAPISTNSDSGDSIICSCKAGLGEKCKHAVHCYRLFSDLRNLSGTTLMNLLAALFMSQLLYVVGVGGVPDSELCIALAFALQYARLCVFCWMLLMTHNMHNQFRTGLHLVPTTDNHIAKNFVKYSLLGWGLPSVLLGASILIQYHDKAGKLLDTTSLKPQNCWFLDKNAFVYGLLAPSCLLVAFTFYYLVRSSVLARYIISIQADIRIREKMRRKRTLQILLFTKLTIVLSIVLALGAVTKLTKSNTFWISYHVGQGLQGILVAMLVTCNCQVLKLYTRSLRSRATRHVPSYTGRGTATALSKSTSLQLLTWDPVPDSV